MSGVFRTYYGVLLVLLIAKAVYGKLKYIPSFNDVKACDDFDNDCFNLDKLTFTVDDESCEEEKGVGLSGPLEIFSKVTDEYDLSLDVMKCTEMGSEPMFSAVTNICQSMKDEDAPWAALFKMMKISSCPIEPDCFHLENFKIAMDSFENCLTKDMCGDYSITCKVMKGRDTLSCHNLGMEIMEVEVPDDE